MANDYMDKWNLNGTEVLLQDAGRGQPNGVATLNEEGKVPGSQIDLSVDYITQMRVSANDPYAMDFAQWTAILASTDFQNRGKSWVSAYEASASTTYGFTSIEYANGLYVAGSGGTLYWSENGNTWTSGTNHDVNPGNIYSIKFANNIWVAQGSTHIVWSENGKDWYKATYSASYSAGSNNNYGRALIYANDLWLCGGTSGVFWSTDGKDWTKSGSFSIAVVCVAYLNGLYLCGVNTDCMYWSTNGKTWTKGTTGLSVPFRDFTYANGLFVAARQNGGPYWSTDGKSWTAGTGTVSNKTTFCVAYYDGLFVVGVSESGVYWSTNGKSWTAGTGDNSALTPQIVIKHNGMWLCKSTGMFYSLDGKAWTLASGANSSLSTQTSCLFAKDNFFLEGTAQNIWKSGIPVWLPPEE